MPVVKCAACKGYLNRDLAVRNGVQSFHESCVGAAYRSASKSKPKKKGTPSDLRRRVLDLDKRRCRFCGVFGGDDLHVHHVLYRSQGGPHEESNLLALCLGCHDKVHSDKRRWQRLCLGVIWLRAMGDSQITVPRLEKMLNEGT